MLLIRNGYVKTMAGPDIENGCVLIGDDGKIVSVGTDIICDGAEVIDAGGRLVTPGCVEAHSISAYIIPLCAGRVRILTSVPIRLPRKCALSTV